MSWKQSTEPNTDPYIYQGGVVLTNWLGYCLAYIQSAFNTPYAGATAWESWTNKTSVKHEDRNFPKGVYFPIWFSHFGNYGVYKNWGHVAICYINPATDKMQIWSSPITNKPFADTWSSIGEIERNYSSTFVGWSEDIAGMKVIEYVDDVLAPNQRKVTNLEGVNGRSEPNTSSTIVKEFAVGDVLDFKGYILVNNVVWFVGAYSDTFYFSGAFNDPSTNGLADLTPGTPVQPVPIAPTLSDLFVKELDCVTSVAQVNLTNFETGNFPAIPLGVVIHDFGTDGKDTLGSSLNQFKAANTTAPHFVVSSKQIIQTGKLTWRMYHAGAKGNDKIGIEVDPDCDTNPETQTSILNLLKALDSKYGQLARFKHSELMQTACGDDIPMEKFSLATMYPAPVPTAPPPPIPTDSPLDVENNKLLKSIIGRLTNIAGWVKQILQLLGGK